MSISGSSGNGNLWLVDGANNNDYGSNRTILVYPSIDNIAEFKILRNSYGPEFGQAAGGVVNIVTRSGSNRFHGSAYYFGRNDALNARDWFLANADQDIGKLRRNDFGFTFGGPIKKDKLFFFYSEEWNKENRGFTRTGTVPTLLEKQGIFTGGASSGCNSQLGLIGQPTLTTLNPAGVAYLKIFPDPNVNPGCSSDGTLAGPNWIESVPSKTDWREDSIRVDYNITPRNSLMVRFSNDTWTNPYPNAGGFYGLWGDDPYPAIEAGWSQPSRSLSAKLTTTIGTTMVNDLQFSYSHNNIATQLGGDQSLLQAIDSAIPVIYADSKFAGNLPAYPTVWGSPYGNLWEESPWANKLDLFNLRDNFSKIMNKHTFKAGFFYGTNLKDEHLGGGAYAEAVTLNSTDQFVYDLLRPGAVFGFNENEVSRLAKVRWHDLEFYAGDSFRVHPRLTLEYGIRWSFFREPFMADDTIASFSPAAFNPAISSPCNGLLLPAGSTACSDLGFAGAAVADNRSLRNSANNNIAPRFGFALDPTGSGKWAIRGGIGQFFQRERVNALLGLGSNPPFLQSTSGTRTLNSATPVTGTIGYGTPGYAIETAAKVPNTWQWNFTIEREIAPNTKLETSYVGSHGVHLLTAYDMNQYHDFTGLGNIWTYADHGSSIYHSLQMAFNGRVGRNLQWQTAYTFSKLISDSSMNWFGEIQNGKFDAVTDIKRPWLDRGLAEQNRPHVFAMNLIYNLPSLDGETGFVKHAFGNWEAATIITAGTGSSVSVFQGGSTSIRPNLVAGQSCEGTGSPIQILNPNAWSLIPDTSVPGVTGNSPRGVCLGPGYANADFALYKNFANLFKGSKLFSEGAKIQFRLEMFNAFNHPQFQFSGANLDFTGSGFGRATRTTGGREIQYALKFVF